MTSFIIITDDHFRPLLAEDDRDGGGGDRLRRRSTRSPRSTRSTSRGCATLHETSALPLPGARLAFSATAYCKGIVTASGVPVQSGVAAADPELLPVGSVIEIDSLPQKYNGIYTVMDTGPAVQGRAGRRLHVELQRGAGVRPQADSPDRAAPRLEPARDDAELPRPLLQALAEPRGAAGPAAAAGRLREART